MVTHFLQRSTVLCMSLVLLLAACGSGSNGFTETFERQGDWGQGDNADVTGRVKNGVYDLLIHADTGLFWATAGKTGLGYGVYELQATTTDGPLDNGYGLSFRVNSETNNFYLFEISGDGYVWIGWCEGGCETNSQPLVKEGWFSSDTIATGLSETHTLRVEYTPTEMIFAINGREVGRVAEDVITGDTEPIQGDVGIVAEALGQGGVHVVFDNFSYTPSEK